MEKVKVLYSSGESRKNPGVGVDYMMLSAEEVELYAECKPNDDEYGTYESLRTAIIEQAKIVGIDCEKLCFLGD